jgi:hypothetical protein
MGIVNAIFAPFIVVYVLCYSFFRYFEVRKRLASVPKKQRNCLTHEVRNH